MTRIYVVHMHGHSVGRTSGGGGFESWPADQLAEATSAYRHEVAQADDFDLLEVNLYDAEAPDGLDDAGLDEWVFDNFEVGTPPVNPMMSFLKGEWPEGGCG